MNHAPYTFVTFIFFLDKHLAVFAIFISRLARGCKYAQNERDFYFVVLQYVKRIVAIFAPHECLFCSLKHCFCTAISMLLKLNVMYLAVQKHASCSTILMLFGKNSDFFSQELTFILPVSLLIFSRSPIHHDWFYCHFIGQKRHPVTSWWWLILLSSLRLTQKETGCHIRAFSYFTNTLRVVPSDKCRRYRPRGRPLSSVVDIRCPCML